jgi:hypothetical protein
MYRTKVFQRSFEHIDFVQEQWAHSPDREKALATAARRELTKVSQRRAKSRDARISDAIDRSWGPSRFELLVIA